MNRPAQQMPSPPSGWPRGVSMLLTTAFVLVTPGCTEELSFDGGGGIRGPDPIASSILPPAVTGARFSPPSSVGVKLAATPGPVGSEGLQLSQRSQEPKGSHLSRESGGTRRSQGSQRFHDSQASGVSKGSKGSKGTKGFQASEGELNTVPASTTLIDGTITTPDAPTTGTTLPPGSTASSSGIDSIGAVPRPHASSKRRGSSRGCLGQYRVSGDQNDECKGDGPQSDETDTIPYLPCGAGGSSADYMERLSGTGSLMERTVGSTSGCPNHVYRITNTDLAMYEPSNTTIPAYPLFLADGGTTTFNGAAGAVGIMLNGVVEFSSYQNSASHEKADDIDFCGGQLTGDGQYYYQTTAGCLQEQAMIVAGTGGGSHTPQLGWAYDGFPIYGQLGPEGMEMKVCGQEGADATHCLDSCSGYEADLPEIDSFKYRYYTSCGFDESFLPSTTNCYRGCCPNGMECNFRVESCDSEMPEPGYSNNYIPVAADPLDDEYDALFLEGNDVHRDDSVDCALYLGAANGF